MAIIEQRLSSKGLLINRKISATPDKDGDIYHHRNRTGKNSVRVSIEPETGGFVISTQGPHQDNPEVIKIETVIVPPETDWVVYAPELKRRIIITG